MVKVLQIQAKIADLEEKYRTTDEYVVTYESRLRRGKMLKAKKQLSKKLND